MDRIFQAIGRISVSLLDAPVNKGKGADGRNGESAACKAAAKPFRVEIVLYSGEQTAVVCAYYTNIMDLFFV